MIRRVLTPTQMKEAEAASEQLGVSLWQLMQNAGMALSQFIKENDLGSGSITVLCGSGNNGGDGFVAAADLAQSGSAVDVYLVCGEPKTELAKKAYALLEDSGARIHDGMPDSMRLDLVVDCIFGTGFHGEIKEPLASMLAKLSKNSRYLIACDVPSGIDCLTGTASQGTMKCSATLTFHAPKLGMLLRPARSLCGDIRTADIGIPDGWDKLLSDRTFISDAEDRYIRLLMPKREEHWHKGNYGRLLLVCGSESYIGAAAIASRAALHTGCGITELAAPREVIRTIAASAPECVYTPLSTDSDGCISADEIPRIIERAAACDAVVLGCGIGQSEDTQKLVEEMIKNVEKPLVIDADGINQLAKNIDVLREKKCEIILTPHIGELGRLCGMSAAKAKAVRYEICRGLTEEYGVTLHSKDAASMTFSGSSVQVTDFGCSALSKGGSGDMLAGVIGSMLAQGADPANACLLGDYIVGRSSELLCKDLSPAAVTATDIIDGFKKTLTLL